MQGSYSYFARQSAAATAAENERLDAAEENRQEAKRDSTCVNYDVPLITGERPQLGHAGTSGLAQHSVGELYPWSVVVESELYSGYCVPVHLISGKRGKMFSFVTRSVGDHEIINTFDKAHAAAEKWVKDHAGCCISQQPTAADVL